ncbi:hypothetical protein ATANTOWER_025241, partial [Ataeniobius toweri]|nr:hypothetical protein [Ataeniobius toweri]
DGVYVRGLYLEGAGWDRKNSCLVEAEPMQMVCQIPTIYFKPVENRKKMSKSELFVDFLSSSHVHLSGFPQFDLFNDPCLAFIPPNVSVGVPCLSSGRLLSVCRYVHVSLLLLPSACWQSRTAVICGRH